MSPSSAPRPRTPAQIEAARRNGAKSRGPVTPEGNARSSKNAVKHGLATSDHILLEGEDAAAFATLHLTLIDENEPESTIEAQLVHRLAVTFWKQARADRLEAKLFAATECPRFITVAGIELADSEAHFDVKRFNAIRGYQVQLAREVSDCLQALYQLKKSRYAEKNEPERRPANPARPPLAPAANEPITSPPVGLNPSRIVPLVPEPSVLSGGGASSTLRWSGLRQEGRPGGFR
jgi:hypothetical protein